MSSRSSLLLQAELYHLKTNKTWGIEKIESDTVSSPSEWNFIISGQKSTCWENARFKLSVRFTRDFNQMAPLVHFLTVPFHPNIDLSSGRPCTALLEEGGWRSDFKVAELLIYLQNLLSEPELENPVNADAAQMLLESPKLYEQLARDAVLASRRFELGMPLFEDYLPTPVDSESSHSSSDEGGDDLKKDQGLLERRIPVKPLSFDDYYESWRNTSTTLNNLLPKRGLIRARDLLKFKTLNSKVDNSHVQEVLYVTEKLKLGHFTNPKTEYHPCKTTATTMLSKMQERIQNMKKLYELKNDVPVSTTVANPPTVKSSMIKETKKIATHIMTDTQILEPPPILQQELPQSTNNPLLPTAISDHMLQNISILANSNPSLPRITASKSSLHSLSSNPALPTQAIPPQVVRVKDPFWDDDEDAGAPGAGLGDEDLVSWATNLPN